MHFVVLNVLEEYIEHHIPTTSTRGSSVKGSVGYYVSHTQHNNNSKSAVHTILNVYKHATGVVVIGVGNKVYAHYAHSGGRIGNDPSH